MILLPTFAVFVGLLIYGGHMLIRRPGRRLRGLTWMLLSPVAAFSLFAVSTEVEDRLAGWPSSMQRQAAEREGVLDPAEWAGVTAAREAEAEAQSRAKAAELEAAAAAAEQAARAAEAAAEAEFQKTGRHCLNPFTGANDPLVDLVTDRLRDPDSFEHIETSITPVEDGKHFVVMTYRARNGFGGMNTGQATGSVESANCRTTILSVE